LTGIKFIVLVDEKLLNKKHLLCVELVAQSHVQWNVIKSIFSLKESVYFIEIFCLDLRHEIYKACEAYICSISEV